DGRSSWHQCPGCARRTPVSPSEARVACFRGKYARARYLIGAHRRRDCGIADTGPTFICGPGRPGGASGSWHVVRGVGSLDTSDTNAQPPTQARLIMRGGHATPLEERMRAKAKTGELLDCGEGPFEPDAMKTWGEERTVNAAVLLDLLVGQQWPVHAKGIWLRGVKVSGLLDLEGAT